MENIQPGNICKLRICKNKPEGYFLQAGKLEIWLSNTNLRFSFKIGQEIEVFLYQNHKNELVATTQKPNVVLNSFGCLKVKSDIKSGYFLDWGIERDLFLPASESVKKHYPGDYVLIFCVFDDFSNRVMATEKFDQFIDYKPPFTKGDKILTLVGNHSPLGFEVIAENKYKGIIYNSQIFRPLQQGSIIYAYVLKVRDDGLIDFTLRMPGFSEIQNAAAKLEQYLNKNYGYLELTDNSNPQEIYKIFGISKKVFKKAIGVLYSQHKILIEEKGIRLIEEED